MQAALRNEAPYWLVYNAITLSYTICRDLMSVNLGAKVHVCVGVYFCVDYMLHVHEYLSIYLSIIISTVYTCIYLSIHRLLSLFYGVVYQWSPVFL